jgi:TonB-linked SusC/RagA family outer membrane protein
MKTKFNGILTLLLALVAQVAFAQQTVTGTVTDPSGEPIFGATVQVKGGTNFATTDFDGKYSIEASAEDTLVISYTGYDPKEVVVGTQSTIDVEMSASLDVVVVEGYRTVNKKKSNVAATTITNETIENRPNASFIQRIQGQIPGLSIQTNTGQPGNSSFVQLRGPSSINGNTEPLFLIDGVPVDEDNFRTLNPNDIDTFTVLKDAAATAVFGNRGANGVIVITTKGGKFDQPLKISYQGTWGVSEITDLDYNLATPQEYLALEKRLGVGRGSNLSDEEIAAYTGGTDWVDTFFRRAQNTNHNISLSGGGKNLSSFTSLSYTEEEGVLQNSRLQRFTLRSNLNGKSDDGKFRYSTRITTGYSKNDSPGGIGGGALLTNFSAGAFTKKPYIDFSEFDRDDIIQNGFTFDNFGFVLVDNFENQQRTFEEVKIVGGLNADYDVVDKLTATLALGVDYAQSNFLFSQDPLSILGERDAVVNAASGSLAFGGDQSQNYVRDFRFNSRTGLTYADSFGENKEHSITASAQVEYVRSFLNSFSYAISGLNPRNFSRGDGGAFVDNRTDFVFAPTAAANKNDYGLFSYFAQADYDYDTRFGFGATIRRDASSRFAADNRWGTFWSVAGRWNIDQESFMANSVFNNLKLRVSYGTQGNDRILGGYYDGLSEVRTVFGTGQGYLGNQTFVRGRLENRDLTWETLQTANIGIDFGAWNNRLRGALELYNRKTVDLFFIDLQSAAVGVGPSNPANLGDMRNRGVELGVSYDLIKPANSNDLALNLFANVAYNDNEVLVVNVPGGLQDNTNTAIAEGQSLNEYYVIPYVGVNPANGQALYLDINGNPTEEPTNADRRFTGTDQIPDFQGGFGFNLSWNNFFIENQWSFMTGIERFDFDLSGFYDPTSIGVTQVSSDLNRAWTPSNRVTDIPSLNATNLAAFTTTSDRFLQEADFLRLRFLQVGWNFPESLTENIFVNGGRIYASAQNLAVFSEWRGNDPERRDGATQWDYPTPVIVNVGLDLTF